MYIYTCIYVCLFIYRSGGREGDSARVAPASHHGRGARGPAFQSRVRQERPGVMPGMQAEHREGRAAPRRYGAGEAGGAVGHGRAHRVHGGRGGEGAASRHSALTCMPRPGRSGALVLPPGP